MQATPKLKPLSLCGTAVAFQAFGVKSELQKDFSGTLKQLGGMGYSELELCSFKGFSEKNWRILDTLTEVSKQLSKSPAQVALNWAATQPGITSTIIGATKPAQLADNLASLDFKVPEELRARLDQVSALDRVTPYTYFTGIEHSRITGETSLHPWMPTWLTGAPALPAEEKNAAGKGA